MDRTTQLEAFLNSGAPGHLVGIGGVSMSPLAKVLVKHSPLTGSDIRESAVIADLRALGIRVAIGHDAKNIEGAQYIIRTAAAREDNPEIAAARAAGIPVFERAEAWGCIMRNYKNALCISGTHGKTTTTSMCTHVLMAAQKDPTVMIGGTLPLIKAGHRVGQGDTIVMESCEYYNSFLSFFPTIAVVLDIEEDHLDFFSGLEDIKNSFRTFAGLVPEDTGVVVANRDDANTVSALAGLSRRILWYGLGEDADVRAENITEGAPGFTFDITCKGEKFTTVKMSVPGLHNVRNALAVAAAAIVLELPPQAVSQGLESFHGAARRFEFKGKLNGALVYDDYAHHPTELRALIQSVRSLSPERIVIAFQPHTYTRTHDLFDDFVRELARADKLYLASIYAAREQNTVGISSKDLADRIPGSVYCPTFNELREALIAEARPGDFILTVGAGDIYTVGEDIVEK